MTTKLNTDIVHEIYVNDDEFYVLIDEPYVITSDVGNRKIYVHEKCWREFKMMNPTLNILPYKYNAIRVTPHPFMDEYNRIIEEYNNSEPDIPDKPEPIKPDNKKYSNITIYCDDPNPKTITSIKDIIYRCKEDDNIDTNPDKVKFDDYDYKMFDELENDFHNGVKKTYQDNNKWYYYYTIPNIDDRIFSNGRHYSMKIRTNYSNININDLISNSKINIEVPKMMESTYKETWKDLSENIKGIKVTEVQYYKKKQILKK